MKKIGGLVAGIVALVSLAGRARAEVLVCEVNLADRIGVSRDGSLNVDMVGAGILNVCSTSETERGMAKETCAAWCSALLSLKLAKSRTIFTSI